MREVKRGTYLLLLLLLLRGLRLYFIYVRVQLKGKRTMRLYKLARPMHIRVHIYVLRMYSIQKTKRTR